MIAINDYRQFIAELAAAAATRSGIRVDHIRLAVTESQLAVLLKDLPGIIVCGNVPSFTIGYPASYWRSEGECLLMVLRKMPRDGQAQPDEFDSCQQLQQLMSAMLKLITGEDMQQFCDQGELDHSQPIRVEWEYNQYGGFNGLSATFHLKDRNGTGV